MVLYGNTSVLEQMSVYCYFHFTTGHLIAFDYIELMFFSL